VKLHLSFDDDHGEIAEEGMLECPPVVLLNLGRGFVKVQGRINEPSRSHALRVGII
jgi:hypothetical protein